MCKEEIIAVHVLPQNSLICFFTATALSDKLWHFPAPYGP